MSPGGEPRDCTLRCTRMYHHHFCAHSYRCFVKDADPVHLSMQALQGIYFSTIGWSKADSVATFAFYMSLVSLCANGYLICKSRLLGAVQAFSGPLSFQSQSGHRWARAHYLHADSETKAVMNEEEVSPTKYSSVRSLLVLQDLQPTPFLQ